jgi:peptidoglycan hydrolase-like protein with peptidoglycan-binding domain
MGTMFDTTDDPRHTFAGLHVEAVATYGNGRFANHAAARAEFPHAHLLEIDVRGDGIGNAGDFEAGDMPFSRAGSWAKQRIQAGVERPVIYFSLSNWRAVMQSLQAAGLSRRDVRIWTAHYDGRPHLCSSACGFGVTGSADATQWASPQGRGTLHGAYAGRNIDVSMTADDFWSAGASRLARQRSRHARLGDSGAVVERLTRRLSYVHSHRSGHPYLDGPRRRFDGETLHALRRFQAEHHLAVDGVYGPASAHALRRAVHLERARRHPVPAATEGTAPSAPAGLAALVSRFRRLDAEADRAWKELAAYGGRRTEVLQRTRAAAGRDVTLADLAVILRRMEGQLETLVEVEQHAEVAAPAAAGGPIATTVVAPAAPATNGDAQPAAPAAPAPVVLAALSDAELLRRANRLDRSMGRARDELIARYSKVERAIARTGGAQSTNGAAAAPAPRPPRRPGAVHHPTVDGHELQVALNEFAERHLMGLAPIVVDGKIGPATRKRIRAVKYYLGYTGPGRKSTAADAALLRRLRRPRSTRYSSPAMLARALRRRRRQQKVAKQSAKPRAGVVKFEGRPVAAWLVPYLTWARQHGWQGTLSSGYRSPAQSEQYCLRHYGAPSCPGKCAGRTSNHSGRIKPHGAIDVTHYDQFAALMRKCPYSPRIFNDLPLDPLHFSSTGH